MGVDVLKLARKMQLNSMYGAISNSNNKVQMADFVLSIDRDYDKGQKYKVNILKNRHGPHNIDDNSIFEYLLESFTEVTHARLSKNKTNIDMFEDGYKEKFKTELREFIENKWKELNEDRT